MHKLIFDIESTGIDAAKDRIVELAIKVLDEQNNTIMAKSKRYNPGIPISKSASDVHGIKDKDVAGELTFKEDAKKLKKLFEDKIIVTYNGLRFDIPLLMAEFERAGVEVTLSGQFIDILKVERKLAPNTLSAVYKKYTGETLEGAHGALTDVNGTAMVMMHQQRLNEISDADLINLTDTVGMADYGGKLKFNDEGFLVFNFGKEKGKRIVDCTNYASWILENNFPTQVKKLIREEQTKGLKGPRTARTAEEAPAEVSPKKTFYNPPPTQRKKIEGGFKPVQTELDIDTNDLPF